MESVHNYFQDIIQTLQVLPYGSVEKVIDLLYKARIANRQIFVMGNGGSAATASHFVCDLLKNTRAPGYPGFRVIGLNDNMATITAAANDEGYENIFALQLENLLEPGDIVVAISTSGCSPNVLQAVKLAKAQGGVTVGFTGKNGGELVQIVDHNIHIPNVRSDQVEDFHLILSHIITATLRDLAVSPVISLGEKLENGKGNDHSNNGFHVPEKNGKITFPFSEVEEARDRF